MKSDIVALLRVWSRWLDERVPYSAVGDDLREAADEIERLREELTASHESHGNEVGALTERLSLAIHERDEARRELCMVISGKGGKSAFVSGDAVDEAKRRGWDCYGVTNGQHLRTSVAESSQEAP